MKYQTTKFHIRPAANNLQIPLLQFCKIAQVVPLKRDVIQEPENKHRTWCNQILKQNLY